MWDLMSMLAETGVKIPTDVRFLSLSRVGPHGLDVCLLRTLASASETASSLAPELESPHLGLILSLHA